MESKIPTHKIEEPKPFIKWRDIKVVPDSVEHAHRHNYYQVMFFDRADGSHQIDFENYPCSNQSLHFVGKGRVHKVNFSKNLKGGVFLFPDALFGSSSTELQLLNTMDFFQPGKYPALELNNDDFKNVTEISEQVQRAIKRNSFDLAKYLFLAFLCEVRDLYNSTETPNPESVLPTELVMFLEQLRKPDVAKLDLSALLDNLSLPATRLNTLCKKQFGKTSHNMLRDRKLLEAKRLLVYTDLQVKEVAYQCGFDDIAYFNRFFKKHVSQTPLAFRNNH